MIRKLIPTNGQKSFYGKATTRDLYPGQVLKSYDTEVCKIVNGKFTRLWSGYTLTTMNHINSFRELHGMNKLSKKEWESLPIGGWEK